MNEYLFYVIVSLILIKFYFKKEIIAYLHISDDLKFIKEKYITYFLIVSLILVIVIGAFQPGSAKNKFKNISDSYKEMKTPKKQLRPNPMFDVDTYPDSKLW